MENCINSRDLHIEILARLPVQSLMRFKCVCKFFYSLIQNDHHFKHKHFEISRGKRDYVVFEHHMPGRDEDRRFGFVFKDLDCDEIGCAGFTFPISPISYIRYADGMFCLVTRIQISVDNYVWDISIWNPAIGEIKNLQNMETLDGFDPNCTAIGFGLSSNMTGKVVMIWTTPDPIVMVCSGEGNNSCGWKRFSHSLGTNFYVNNTGSNLYVKGKHYWICTVQDQNKEQNHLLWFDFDDETFGKIELPEMDLAAISAMKDTIALISYCITSGNYIEIWTMSEHNNIIGWNKYARVEGSNHYSHPMRIWNLGAHLLVYNQMFDDGVRILRHFTSYDLVTKEKKNIYTASWNFYMYPPVVYSQSLKSF